MKLRVDIPPVPTIYCPKEGGNVPIWYCLGSFTQGRLPCPLLIKARIYGGKRVEVECEPRKGIGAKDA